MLTATLHAHALLYFGLLHSVNLICLSVKVVFVSYFCVLKVHTLKQEICVALKIIQILAIFSNQKKSCHLIHAILKISALGKYARKMQELHMQSSKSYIACRRARMYLWTSASKFTPRLSGRPLFLCTKAVISLVSFLLSRMASSFVYKVLYFLRVLSGKSPSSFLKCLCAAATPWTAAYFPNFALVSLKCWVALHLRPAASPFTFKCLRNRLAGFFDSSLTKAGTFRSQQGVFFSKIVQNTHCSSRANLHYVDTSTQPPLRMREHTLKLCHLICVVALGSHEIAWLWCLHKFLVLGYT